MICYYMKIEKNNLEEFVKQRNAVKNQEVKILETKTLVMRKKQESKN